MTTRKRRTITAGKRYRILKRDGFRCVYCGRSASDTEVHVDHKLPVSEGGSDRMDNLVTACRDCNLGKGAKTAEPPRADPRPPASVDAPVLKVRRKGLWGDPNEYAVGRLWLMYEVELEPITDDHVPAEIDASSLLRRWVSRIRERRSDTDPVPILWFVEGDEVGPEWMPPNEPEDFLDFYGQPQHPETHKFVPFEALPVAEKRWHPDHPVTKGGFIQEALGWSPVMRQRSVTLAELHELAHRRLKSARGLDARMVAAATLAAFRPSGHLFEPIPDKHDVWGECDWEEFHIVTDGGVVL